MDGPERGYGASECGTCRLWRPILEDGRGLVGPCRLGVRTGDFPGTAPRCERYLGVDAAIPVAPGPGRSPRRPVAPGPVLHPARGGAGEPPGGPEQPSPSEEVLAMTREELAQVVREVLQEETRHVALAPKWEGGTMVLRPRDAALQAKEVGLDQLFHKVVMIRDRLRVLEQKINASEKLSDAEKVDMQSYVTRCYGSLTTFNVLFRDERDRFVGEKGAT